MEKESEKWIRNKEEMPTFAPSTIIKLNTDMKRIVFLIAALVIAGASSLRVQAQHDYGYFNSLGVGLSVSTTGIGVDLATPIGNYLALRAGISFMPNISFDTDVDVDITSNGQTFDREMNVGGELGRATGEVLVNVYPFRSLGLFACVGASFGGNTLVKINGHSDELAQDIATGQSAGIEIGDYTLPVDENGNVSGGLRTNNFRPYVGLGWGRAVPSKRVNFMFELGVQFHGTPEVYTDYGNLEILDEVSDDNTFNDIIDKLTVYPVIKFRLAGRIF